MPKINAAGVPSWDDARGTDETAVNAHGEEFYLDPTASVQDGELKDNPGLEIADDEDAETREQRTERQEQERKDYEREHSDSGRAESALPQAEGDDKPRNVETSSTFHASTAGADKASGKSGTGAASLNDGTSQDKADAQGPQQSGGKARAGK